MKTHVYIAGRSEDQVTVRSLREKLRAHGISSTARWLDPDGIVDNKKAGAVQCLMDIGRASVFLIVNLSKIHRSGTGGRHVETGIALMLGKPIVILGARENVFHHLDSVRCVEPTPQTAITDLVAVITEAAENPPSPGDPEHQLRTLSGGVSS